MSVTSPPGSLLGAERPRVEVRPSGVAYSLGAEAVELAERAGLHLEPWQRSGLDLMLSVRPDGRWACFEYAELLARQNGKTTGLFAPRALAGLLLLGERLIMWSAHEYKTAMDSFLQMRDLLLTLGEPAGQNLIAVDGFLVKVNNTNGEESFERLDTRQRIKFIARSKGSGRGFSPDTLLIDEAFAYTRGQQSAQAPSLSARPNPQTCLASSPPLEGVSGEVLYALRERAEAGEEGVGWRDWGLALDLDDVADMTHEQRAALLDDRGNWAATNPAVGRGRMTEEHVARNRRSMADLDFAREILGVWPRRIELGRGDVIDMQRWSDLARPTARMLDPLVFSIEVNEDRSTGAICAAGRGADRVPVGEAIDYRPRQGIGWLVARAAELDVKHQPIEWVIDPNSPAGALLPDLVEAGIVPLEVTGREAGQACAAFHDAVHTANQDRFVHLGQSAVDIALRSATRKPIGEGLFVWVRRGSADITPLTGLTLALHGLVNTEAMAPMVAWA